MITMREPKILTKKSVSLLIQAIFYPCTSKNTVLYPPET